MLLDFLSYSNCGKFNISLAHIIGLEKAIYLNALLDLCFKNAASNEYFIVDREEIQKRTTFNSKKQLELQASLVDIGVVLQEDASNIKLDLQIVLSLLTVDDEVVIQDLKKVVNKKKDKNFKEQCILDSLKSHVQTLNLELRTAYFNWIDAVYEKDGYMTTSAVNLGQKKLDEFCNHDLDRALEVLQIAAINAYRDISWAINSYQSSNYIQNRRVNTNLEASSVSTVKELSLSDEVF